MSTAPSGPDALGSRDVRSNVITAGDRLRYQRSVDTLTRLQTELDTAADLEEVPGGPLSPSPRRRERELREHRTADIGELVAGTAELRQIVAEHGASAAAASSSAPAAGTSVTPDTDDINALLALAADGEEVAETHAAIDPNSLLQELAYDDSDVPPAAPAAAGAPPSGVPPPARPGSPVAPEFVQRYRDAYARLQRALDTIITAEHWNIGGVRRLAEQARSLILAGIADIAQGRRNPNVTYLAIRGVVVDLRDAMRREAGITDRLSSSRAVGDEPDVRLYPEIIRDIEREVRVVMGDRKFWRSPEFVVGDANVHALGGALLAKTRTVRPVPGSPQGTYNRDQLPGLREDLAALVDAMEIQFRAFSGREGWTDRAIDYARGLYAAMLQKIGRGSSAARIDGVSGGVRQKLKLVGGALLAALLAWGGCELMSGGSGKPENGGKRAPAGAPVRRVPAGSRQSPTLTRPGRTSGASAKLRVPSANFSCDVSLKDGKLLVKLPSDVNPSDVVLYVGLPDGAVQIPLHPPADTEPGSTWTLDIPEDLQGAPTIGVGASVYVEDDDTPRYGSFVFLQTK